MKKQAFRPFLILLGVSSLLFSCQSPAKKISTPKILWKTNSYATLFQLGTAANDSFIILKHPDGTVLSKVFWGESDSVAGFRKIPQRNRIVSLAAPFSYMIAELGGANKIVGIENKHFISHPYFLNANQEFNSQLPIAEVSGSDGNIIPEKLVQTNPDLVWGFWVNKGDQEFAEGMTKNKIPFLWCMNWLEAHPLGRSEWIKAFGWVLGTPEKSEKLFQSIQDQYNQIKSKSSTENPCSVAANIPYPNGMWMIPVDKDLFNILVADAGGKLIAQPISKAASQTPIEKAVSIFQNAPIWINTDMYFSYEKLLIDQPKVASIVAFKNKQLYHYNLLNNQQINMRNPFWDRANLYAYEILEDLQTLFNHVKKQGNQPLPANTPLHYYKPFQP